MKHATAPKKVLIVTYYWPPAGGAGVQRSLKFVKYLPEFGLLPVVITVDPSRSTFPVRDESLVADVPSAATVVTTGSFEPLRWLNVLSRGKAKIPHGGFTNQKKDTWSQRILRFIRGNFFIPDARIGWVRHAVKAADKIIRQEGIETVVISSPPHSSQLVGLKLKKIHPSIRWVADLRDPWTDIYYYNEMHHLSFAKRKDADLEREVLEGCDVAVVVSDQLKQLFSNKISSADTGKFAVIPNGYDAADFLGEIHPSATEFCITYVGTIADNYRPEVFLESLQSLKVHFPEVPLRLRFVGSPSRHLPALLREYRLLDSTEFIPHVTHQEAIRYMRQSSLLLLLIPVTTHDRLILTGKLFEYLGSGVPVVGIGPEDGDAALVLDTTGAGRMFDREHGQALSEHLIGMYLRWRQHHDLRHGKNVSAYERRRQAEIMAEVITNRKKS